MIWYNVSEIKDYFKEVNFMDIADLAASAVKKITTGKGKRLAKKGYPAELEKVSPVTISRSEEHTSELQSRI